MEQTSIVLVKPKQFIEGKRAEVSEGQRVIAELVKIKECPKGEMVKVSERLAEARSRVKFTQRFINLAEAGFVPLPRMERILISEDTALPADAISAIVSFKQSFDAFAIVNGSARGKTLDPMLIGIIRDKDLEVEEHFLLGWWRPDLISPSQLW